MEVVLRSEGASGWDCTVKLRFESPSEVPAGRKLETVEFAKTQTPDEVSHIIRRAQLSDYGRTFTMFAMIPRRSINVMSTSASVISTTTTFREKDNSEG